jgi:catechol 2,3-dioxygenase-like lactoylglutathione lyase family enzyme
MNLNQITIPSLDVNRSVHFYKNLGLIQIVDALPRYARFECPDGTATFSIHEVPHLPTGEGITIYFECDDLDAQVEKLIEKGISFEEMPADKPWLWREARLKDPDNNQLILYFAGDIRKNPPWRLQTT